MTNPILTNLMTLGRDLDQVTDELAQALETEAHAKHAYEVAYARSFLGGTGSVDARKQLAVLDTAAASLALSLANVSVRVLVEKLRSLRARIEIGRSLNAARRSEMEL